MRARIPQDVDLEDRLVLGLTPVRFGYLVIGGLAAFCAWSGRWGPAPLRLAVALPLLLAGILFAWGRVRGCPLDRWAADLSLYLNANFRLAPEARHPAAAEPPEMPLRLRGPRLAPSRRCGPARALARLPAHALAAGRWPARALPRMPPGPAAAFRLARRPRTLPRLRA